MKRLEENAFELPIVRLRFYIVIMWITMNMLPQAMFALWNLIAVVGTDFEDVRKVLFTYPQFLLCPMFSVYTFGSADANHWCYR